MVKHIVMFKLKERTQENLDRAVASLKTLEGNIETLRSIEIGLDFKHSERSYDLVITTVFDDQAGLEVYATHPNHLPVIQTIRELTSGSVVVDYEC